MTNNSPSANEKRTDDKGLADQIRLAIPLAIAVVASVFVALGIEGDVRARIIRNNPLIVSMAFGLAIIGLAIPIVDIATSKNRRRLLGQTGSLVLLGGALLAVVIGTRGLSEREHPALDVDGVLSDPAEGIVTLTVEASAPTLRSEEKMLVRIAALRSDGHIRIRVLVSTTIPCYPSVAPARILRAAS